MAKAKPLTGKITAPDPCGPIGEAEVGGERFELVYSVNETIQRVAKKGPAKVLSAYRYVTGDTRTRVDYDAALRVVQGEVQEAWYEAKGKPLPERCIRNQKERIEYAMSTETTANAAEGTSSKKTLKIADVIRESLLAGKGTEEVVADVQAAFPESKANGKTVAYYRHQLRKEGLLAARAKKSE